VVSQKKLDDIPQLKGRLTALFRGSPQLPYGTGFHGREPLRVPARPMPGVLALQETENRNARRVVVVR
jgi:hypothetical protein